MAIAAGPILNGPSPSRTLPRPARARLIGQGHPRLGLHGVRRRGATSGKSGKFPDRTTLKHNENLGRPGRPCGAPYQGKSGKFPDPDNVEAQREFSARRQRAAQESFLAGRALLFWLRRATHLFPGIERLQGRLVGEAPTAPPSATSGRTGAALNHRPKNQMRAALRRSVFKPSVVRAGQIDTSNCQHRQLSTKQITLNSKVVMALALRLHRCASALFACA
jgi:hypothetical protein